MAGPIDSLEAAILDHLLLGTTYTPPANWFIGLSTTTPTETGSNFTEPVGNAYARVSTSGATWSAAVGGAPSTKSNAAQITFPVATGSWGTITYWGLFIAASGGTVQIFGVLAVATAVNNNNQFTVSGGGLIVELGDPSDTY